MGASSSKQKPPVITSHDRAILDLKVQRDKLKKLSKQLAAVVEQETAAAKFHLAKGDKRRALIALKRKKHREGMMVQVDAQLINLEQMTETIEFTLIEKDVVEGLKQGNKALTELQKEMNLDSVTKLMEDTADAIAYQNEIDEILSGQISKDDMEEIEEELDALVAAEFQQMPQIPENTLPETPIELPDVPLGNPGTTMDSNRVKLKAKQVNDPMLAE